jgi:hypothetical protein
VKVTDANRSFAGHGGKKMRGLHLKTNSESHFISLDDELFNLLKHFIMSNQFKERLRTYSDLSLVKAYNNDLGHNGWVSSRGEFHIALRAEMYRRGLNPGAIMHMRGFHLKKEFKSALVAMNILPIQKLGKQILAQLILDTESKKHEVVLLSPKLVLLNDPIVKLKEHLEYDQSPILFAVQHENIQTVFDVSGLKDQFLIGFNTRNKIKSVNWINGDARHVFQMAVSSKTLLSIPKKVILESSNYLLGKRTDLEIFINDIVKIELVKPLNANA